MLLHLLFLNNDEIVPIDFDTFITPLKVNNTTNITSPLFIPVIFALLSSQKNDVQIQLLNNLKVLIDNKNNAKVVLEEPNCIYNMLLFANERKKTDPELFNIGKGIITTLIQMSIEIYGNASIFTEFFTYQTLIGDDLSIYYELLSEYVNGITDAIKEAIEEGDINIEKYII